MRRSIKTGLALLASGAAMLLVDDGARGGSRRVLAGARRLISRKPVIDEKLALAVRAKLERVTEHARSIRAEVDHGCAVLSGDVLTSERARLVRAVSRVPGVDSVVDLMSEHSVLDEFPPSSREPIEVHSELPPPRARGRVMALRHFVSDLQVRGPLSSLPARAIEAGAGLGLSLAGLKLRGIVGLPLGIVGAALFAHAMATGVHHVRRARKARDAGHARRIARQTGPGGSISREPAPSVGPIRRLAEAEHGRRGEIDLPVRD